MFSVASPAVPNMRRPPRIRRWPQECPRVGPSTSASTSTRRLRQQPTINAYFDGIASVIGKSRTGAYGSYYVIKRLFDGGKIAWGWQTYAWSGGNWDSRAQLRQVQNGLENGQLDKDQAMAADFGQWGASGGSTPPPEPCDVQGDGKLHCGNAIDAPLYADHSYAGGAVKSFGPRTAGSIAGARAKPTVRESRPGITRSATTTRSGDAFRRRA